MTVRSVGSIVAAALARAAVGTLRARTRAHQASAPQYSSENCMRVCSVRKCIMSRVSAHASRARVQCNKSSRVLVRVQRVAEMEERLGGAQEDEQLHDRPLLPTNTSSKARFSRACRGSPAAAASPSAPPCSSASFFRRGSRRCRKWGRVYGRVV